MVLEGAPPALAGWTLAAIVDHRSRNATLRIVSPVARELDRRRFREPHCDHCGVRRRRTETFVLWHAATQRIRQVGSGCLRDFLGGHHPERLCREAEYVLLARQALRDAGDAPSARGGAGQDVSLREFAAHAAHVIRAGGWVSREYSHRSSRVASGDAALRSMQTGRPAPNAADRTLARAALTWARELLAAQRKLSPFERDAVAVTAGDRVFTSRERGLVCALIAVYRRRRARSQHMGEPGAALERVVLVERITEQPSQRHGIVRRHDLIDVDGNRFTWWQTRGTPLPLGRAIHLRGRIERHATVGRAAVTVLARCRPLDR
jgi:hypothetical protein